MVPRYKFRNKKIIRHKADESGAVKADGNQKSVSLVKMNRRVRLAGPEDFFILQEVRLKEGLMWAVGHFKGFSLVRAATL